jgi:hypothetical protein
MSNPWQNGGLDSPSSDDALPPEQYEEASVHLPEDIDEPDSDRAVAVASSEEAPSDDLTQVAAVEQPSSIVRRPPSIVRRPSSVSWWEPTYVFFITFIIFALVTPRILTYLNPVTGDEPFYLMTATSILKDRDLNECNNYRQRDETALYPPAMISRNAMPDDWLGFGSAPYPLPPHPAQILPESRRCLGSNVKPLLRGIPSVATPLPADGTENELYSKHGLGLSLLVTLPFGLGGRALVVFFLNALGALLAANIYLLARESTGKIWIGVLTWIAFAFTVPLMPYSFLIFPELPAALLVLYAFRRIRLQILESGPGATDSEVQNPKSKIGQNGLVRMIAIGLCIAFLPWLHYRFVPLSAGLFAYLLYTLIRDRRLDWDDRLKKLSPVLGLSIASAILLMGYFNFLYGHVWPSADDHAGISDVAGTMRGIVGTFLDAQWGLFVAAPIYILAIVGLILMAIQRGWRADLLWVTIIGLPYFLLVANYAQWWGEWCPPARYLTSVLPMMALPFGVALLKIPSPFYKAIYGVLLAVSLAVMGAFIYQPQWMYNQPTGTSELLSQGLARAIVQLPPETIAGFPTQLQPSIDEKTGNLVVSTFGLFPTFVVPYFGYLTQGQDSGDYWAQQAWEHSTWPSGVILGIVVVCLLLALWEWRKERRERLRETPPDEELAVMPGAAIPT